MFIFQGGTLKDNYVVKGTAAGAGKGNFSESEQQHKITVPAGKRWLLWGGHVKRDANATMGIQINNSSDQMIHYLHYRAAAAETVGYGGGFHGTANAQGTIPVPMKAGDYLQFDFGANQAATASISAIVTEVDE